GVGAMHGSLATTCVEYTLHCFLLSTIRRIAIRTKRIMMSRPSRRPSRFGFFCDIRPLSVNVVMPHYTSLVMNGITAL
ncbi:hypothetical protein PENTCL1PPCAC_14418, partial [Pristionchus entomophagus]